MKPYTIQMFSPVFKGYGEDSNPHHEHRKHDHPSIFHSFDEEEDAIEFANNEHNRRAFPLSTTGEVVKVEITIKPI